MSRTQAEPGKGVKGLKIEISQVKPYFRAHSLISELFKVRVRVAVKEFTSALTSLRLWSSTRIDNGDLLWGTIVHGCKVMGVTW